MKRTFLFFIVISFFFFGPMKADIFQTINDLFYWTISAGPTWYEAYKFSILLSDERTLKLFGDECVEVDEENYIRSVLDEYVPGNWETIPIKSIKEDIRIFIPFPLICTDSIIFVNPDVYDLFSRTELQEVIIEIGRMIKSKFTLTSTFFLALLPFATHFSVKLYINLIESLAKKLQIRRNSFINELTEFHTSVTDSAICKLLLNYVVAEIYFRYKAEEYKSKVNFPNQSDLHWQSPMKRLYKRAKNAVNTNVIINK